MDTRKRGRAPNWSNLEIETLLELVYNELSIIENKKTDGLRIGEKEFKWQNITAVMNERFGSLRTRKMLQDKWKVMKKIARGVGAIERKALTETGGGPQQRLNFPHWVPRVREMLSISAQGFQARGDSDDIQTLNENDLDKDDGCTGTTVEVCAADWSRPDRTLLRTPLSAPLYYYNEESTDIDTIIPEISSPSTSMSHITTSPSNRLPITTPSSSNTQPISPDVSVIPFTIPTTSSTPPITITTNPTTTPTTSMAATQAATRLGLRRTAIASRKRPPTAAADAAITLKKHAILKGQYLKEQHEQYMGSQKLDDEQRKIYLSWAEEDRKYWKERQKKEEEFRDSYMKLELEYMELKIKKLKQEIENK